MLLCISHPGHWATNGHCKKKKNNKTQMKTAEPPFQICMTSFFYNAGPTKFWDCLLLGNSQKKALDSWCCGTREKRNLHTCERKPPFVFLSKAKPLFLQTRTSKNWTNKQVWTEPRHNPGRMRMRMMIMVEWMMDVWMICCAARGGKKSIDKK